MTRISKLILFGGMTGVTSTAGTATYFYLTRHDGLIRGKYSDSLISKDAKSIWEDRWNSLKKQDAKVHSNNESLKQALSKKDSNETFADEIKDLLQKGCDEIYDSKFVSTSDNNFKDFKEYCSLRLKDNIKNLITEAPENQKWQAKLDKLKKYEKELIKELTDIKVKTESKQEEIKNLCDKVKEEMFESEKDIKFINVKEFCSATDS